MDLFFSILGCAILGETSFLCYKSLRRGARLSKRKIYVDTSALMDGRILEVARTGFISDNMIIPRSVLREMQLLADGKDGEKRTRARAGLDVASELERVEFFDVEILQDALDRTPVDERLIELAKNDRGAAILTCDYNLNKVAQAERIEVLNVNDLALVLGQNYLPGEKALVKITGKGQNRGQGVGYLKDGTMVIVSDAVNKIGQQVEIEFERHIQTAAGRMVFAKPVRRQK